MKNIRFLLLTFLVFTFSSCNKEVEISPANIYGDWAHYYEMSNYFEAMRFKENGDFFFMERFGYEKELKEKDTDGAKFFFTLEDKKVTIYRQETNSSQTFIRSFIIKSLTNVRMTEEEGNYLWKRQ